MNPNEEPFWQNMIQSIQPSPADAQIADLSIYGAAVFEQMKRDSESLAEELLFCYEQLNIAFESTRALAQCKTVDQALTVMTAQIGRAIQSRYSYYVGPLSSRISLLGPGARKESNVIVLASDPDRLEDARNFYQTHIPRFASLLNAALSSRVENVDYQGTYDLDQEGRGNALAVRLESISRENPNPGSLLFVRGDDQPLFAAVDMNLAETLAKTSAAVLEEILYAEKLHRTYLQAITSLVRAMEAKDPYTGGHSTRVAETACELGRFIGLAPSDIQLLEWAGMMHDIGKIGVRDDVLQKTGRLTAEEFEHIKTHPVKSFNVLEPIDALQSILSAVRHHHEHYDGSGYPDGLRGEKIPFFARILQVADVWDALTSTRPYRASMSKEKAIEIMRQEAGHTMDPQLVKQFEALLRQKQILP